MCSNSFCILVYTYRGGYNNGLSWGWHGNQRFSYTYTTPDPQILLPQFTLSVIASFKKLSSTTILLDNHLWLGKAFIE